MRPGHSCVVTLLFAGVPIAVSIGTCALWAICEGWYASSLTLLGIALRSADFVFTHPELPNGPLLVTESLVWTRIWEREAP